VLNPATLTIVDQPSNGTVNVDLISGDITYQHDDGVSTSDTFTYTVDDEVNATSNVATVTITIASGMLQSSGLVVALETDAGVSTDGSDGVLGWLDSSGLGNDLQTVVGDPTVVSAATPSGADAIHFDGDDSLARLGATDALNGLSTGTADRSVFVVARYNSSSVYAGVAYGTANQLDHYRDGEVIDSAFHAFNTQATDLKVAEEIDGSGFADMDVAAVLIYDRALTELERHEVQAYLHSKYL
jgi:hypothetical protein